MQRTQARHVHSLPFYTYIAGKRCFASGSARERGQLRGSKKELGASRFRCGASMPLENVIYVMSVLGRLELWSRRYHL
jgi:hypothetical protein